VRRRGAARQEDTVSIESEVAMFGCTREELLQGWRAAERRGYDRLLYAMAILSDAQRFSREDTWRSRRSG
jgi:hypothetical protein